MRTPPRPNERGYTLVELLVSMAIMMVVTGAIFQLVNPGQATSQTQPEVQDQQQRMRVASDALFKDLVMAGAGPYQGSLTGSLLNYFAPILPRKTGYSSPDPSDQAYADRITITYVPNTYTQTSLSATMPIDSEELKADFDPSQPGCPADGACGFSTGDEVLIFDQSGNFDAFTVTLVQDSANHLQHRGQNLSHVYAPPTAVILKVNSYSFYLDRSTNQLMRYDGGSDAPTPIVDNVVDLNFDYFGDPGPPQQPKPPLGQANCLYDALGNYVAAGMTTVSGDGSMAALPLSMFTDGPWCGSGSNQFDADLFRVRKLRVTLRVQTPIAALRGHDTTLFRNPGTSASGQRMIPDLVTSFDVTPRNMNLSR
jgi:prepilin-type N-terminal cleavage/methylation domain-containing protein